MQTENEPITSRAQTAQVVVIVNATARLGSDDRLSPERLEESLRERSISGRVQPTTSEEDCYEQIARAAQEGAEVVVAAGGDGTAHTVITGLMRLKEHRPAFGLIACGTMNNVAATFGIPEDVDAGLDLLGECVKLRRFFPMDVGLIEGEPFIEVASVGTLARLTPLGEHIKSEGLKAGGDAVVAVRELVAAKPERVTLWLDGRRISVHALEITICNTPSHGARMVLSPDTRVDDGLLDVVVDGRVSGPRMLWDMVVGADVHKMTRERRSIFRARRVRITQESPWSLEMDAIGKGEYGLGAERLAVEATVAPGAIMVCAEKRPTPGGEAVTEPTLQTMARLLPATAPTSSSSASSFSASSLSEAPSPVKEVAQAAEGVAQAAGDVAQQVSETVERQLTTPERAAIRLRKMRWVYVPGIALGAVGALAARRWAILPGDREIQRAIQSAHSPRMDKFMTAVAAPGFPPLSIELVGVGVVGLWLMRLRLEAAFLLGAAGGVTALDTLLKGIIRRKRPVDGPARVLKVINAPSFPSGHVMNYVAVFGFFAAATIANVKPRWLRYLLTSLCGAIISLIGPARVYLGAHWPSDTAAGYLFGGLYLGGLLEAYTIAKEKQAQRRRSRKAHPSTSQ